MSYNNSNKFTFIDLFAGIGGFRMALDNLGGVCKNFSEINKDAIETYCNNFQENTDCNLGDITKVSALPQHDLLTGGVPCQSWSIAGKNLGFDDDRGQLWNDTIYLLAQSKPKAFIFENVKGLVDPRNKNALQYILQRIKEAGYFAQYFLLNAFDYGVPQSRIRVYIIGFHKEEYLKKFNLPKSQRGKVTLENILSNNSTNGKEEIIQRDLFDNQVIINKLQSTRFNDYFLFNDLRNGHSTVHSWDLIETTEKQKNVCDLLLKNRRKSAYGHLDGNPLSLNHFQNLDNSIAQNDIDELVELSILKPEEYCFEIIDNVDKELTDAEKEVLEENEKNILNIDVLKSCRNLKLSKNPIFKTIESLKEKGVIACIEIRYDFKNTKMSTGINGINRVFLPCAAVFPTLVASDTNDFVALTNIEANNEKEYKEKFMEEVYGKNLFRKITKEEACLIQGFPKDFKLPTNRARWMKLIGNSVSVPVVEQLGASIIQTGVFDE